MKLAKKLGLRCIAIPRMGTGIGRVLPEKAVKAITIIVKEFENKFETIILIGRNKEIIDSFNSYL